MGGDRFVRRLELFEQGMAEYHQPHRLAQLRTPAHEELAPVEGP